MCRSTVRISRVTAVLAALVALVLVAALTPGRADAAASGEGKINRLLHRMTLEEKVGQLFVPYVYGESVDTTNPADVAENRKVWGVDNGQQLIDKYHLGGIIYYAWSNNVNDPQQIAGLSNGIQRVAASQRLRIPALVAVDQEGGIVARVGPPATQVPGNMALGATRSNVDAFTAAKLTGKELRAIGINQDYAPVADVNVNPQNPVIGVRSFGSEPRLVSRLTAAQVSGYQNAGVSASLKHFPGHGDTDKDSHVELPTINHTREQWEQLDRPPFQAGIDRGVDAIMTAHITVPSLDPTPGLPATLSEPIMTGILRGEMGYEGVIVSDALDMGGASGNWGDDRVPVLALKAGVDVLLKPPDGKLDLQYNAVLDAVRSGELTERRIDESVTRILRLKLERGLFENPYVDESKVDDVVGKPKHLAAAQEVADHSTTLVKNDAGVLPLSADERRDVLVTGWGSVTTQTLADQVAERGQDVERYYTGTPTDEQIATAVEMAEERDLVVVTTNRAWSDAQQAKLVNELTATGTPVVAVAVRDPYDIAYYPDTPTYLATYSYGDVAVTSLTKALFGEVNPRGKLPVAVPEAGTDDVLYRFGHGLSYG